ncbi:MAG: HAD family hydrolase, partial [Chloroflexota bacterium]
GEVRWTNCLLKKIEPVVRRFEAIRRESIRRLLASFELESEATVDELTEYYFTQRFGLCQVYPDVRPCLEELQGHVRVALLSNGNTYPDRIGVAEYFQAVCFGQDIGFNKPDPRAFKAVEQALGCEPHEMVAVGDSLVNDVQGAQAVGWQAVWLNTWPSCLRVSRESPPTADRICQGSALPDSARLINRSIRPDLFCDAASLLPPVRASLRVRIPSPEPQVR